DGRLRAFARAAVDRDEFADDVAVADTHFGDLTAILLVLRRRSDDGERMELTMLADRRMAVDDDVREQPRALAELDVLADEAERPDFHAARQFGAGMHDRGRVDVQRMDA